MFLVALVATLIVIFPEPTTPVFSSVAAVRPVQTRSFSERAKDPAVTSIDEFLKRHQVDDSLRTRVAESVVQTAKRYNLDARLIASIIIVESRANPFAISASDSIGIMQIHLGTWGMIADREGINLFKIEDNIAFGARILKDYVHQFGLWEGVKRYNGWIAGDADSERSAEAYVAKVQSIYGLHPAIASSAAMFQ